MVVRVSRSGRQVVLDRAETSELLLKVFSDSPATVGRVMSHIDGTLLLSGEGGRAVYFLEASEGVGASDVLYLSEAFREVGVSAVLLPHGAVRYVAEVDSVSMAEGGAGDVSEVPEPAEPEASPEAGGQSGLGPFARVRLGAWLLAQRVWRALRPPSRSGSQGAGSGRETASGAGTAAE